MNHYVTGKRGGNRVAATLWAARLDRPLTERETAALLAAEPPARLERLARLRRAEQRDQTLCAWLLLRTAAREDLGLRTLPPIARTDRGKPCFPDGSGFSFNLSHTGGAVMAGISDRPIGVDIERIRPPGRHLLERLGPDLTPEEFFARWVRREARAKCGGEGVAALLGPEPPRMPGEAWAAVETFPGYAAAAAVLGGPLPGPPRLLTLEELLGLNP